jgi:hypothetical protein
MAIMASSDEAAAWFTGDEPRTDDEARFLDRLRVRAVDWVVPGLDHSTSWCLAKLACLLVVVPSPSLIGLNGLHSIQVGYYPAGKLLRLEGEWGEDHLLDSGGDERDLRIHGVEADPEWFVDVSADWIGQQLLRPLVQEEWLVGSSVVASQTRLDDTGFVLSRSGSWLRMRKEPDRKIRLN